MDNNDIRIDVWAIEHNVDQTLADLRQLQSLEKKMSKKKLSIQVKDTISRARKQIDELNRSVDKINNKKIQMKLDLSRMESGLRTINKLLKNGLIGQEAAKYLKANEKAQFINKYGDSSIDTNPYEVYVRGMAEANAEAARYKGNIREINTEIRAAKNLDMTPRFDAAKLRAKVTSITTQIGSRITALGGALSNITAPIDMLLRGSLYSVAATGLSKISEGFSRSFSRYDTLSTYPKIMASLGYSAEQASDAVHQLDESVLGLPTSLDDIVSAQKVFVLASGDMEKATKLAIAANNAFVGGGATEEQRMYGMRQLQDLLSAGKLRSQEWYSLFKSMPAAIQAAGKELGYTGKKTKEFQSALMEGDVSTDQFLDALIKVGSEGGVIYDLAQQMKSTWSAVSANISIAFARMGQHALEAADTVFEMATGKNLLQNVMELREYINGMSEDFQAWIKANPTTIMKFFNGIKSIDAVGIAKGMAEALSTIGGVLLKFVGLFDGKGKTLGKTLIYANLAGKALKILGLSIKGSAGTVGWIAWFGANMANLSNSSKLMKVGIIAKLSKFFKGFKGVEKGAEAVAGAGTAAAGATAATASLGTLFANLLSIVTPAIAIGAYAGAFALVGKAISSFGKSMQEIGKIKINFVNMEKNLGKMAIAVVEIGLFTKAFGAVAFITGKAGAILGLIGGGTILAYAKFAEQVAKAMNVISEAKIPDTERFSDLKDALVKIGELYAEIDTGSFWESLKRRFRSGQDNKYLKNIESMTKSVTGILDNVQSMMDKVKEISKISKVKTHAEHVSKQLEAIGTFVSGLYGTIDGFLSGDWGEKEQTGGSVGGTRKANIEDATKKFEKFGTYLLSIDSTLNGIESIPKHIIRIHDKMQKVKDSTSAGGEGKIDKDAIAKSIRRIVGLVTAVVDDGNLDELKAASDKLQGIDMNAIEQPLDKIPELLGKLQKLRDYFDKNGTKWLTPTGTETKSQGLKAFGGVDGLMSTSPTYDGKAQTMIESIGRIATFFKEIANKLTGVKDISDKVTTFHTGVTALYNAYKRFTNFSNYVDKNPVNSDGMKQNLSKIITDVIGALAGAPLMYTYSLAFKSSITNITKSLKSVTSGKSGSVSSFIDGLKKIPKQLQAVSNAMKGKGTYWKNQLVNGFKGTSEAILERVREISLKLAEKGYYSNFYQAGASAGTSYSNGFNNSINLNTPSGGGVISNLFSGLFGHTGGQVTRNGFQYFSKGGLPTRGVDRIPAMLAEGEYVMQRKATRGFGTKFMQRINNLDLGGAIEALGMRGGRLAFASPTINVDNSRHITYNNNQSVSLTNNHASQGYSEARASRYVRSLK